MTDPDIKVFIDTFDGEIFRPGDDGYDDASKVFEAEGHPAIIVRPRSAEAIVQAVKYAGGQSLELSVKSGGHSGAGFSTNDDGLVVDMKHFADVEVLDKDAGTVRIGSGAIWGDVADTLAGYNLAISSGDTSTVGVGGLTLGGGIGWMVRKHGLTVDNVLEAEIVTADGRLLTANENTHSDLFWALRGGGGNFGIVTRFTFQAVPNHGVVVATIQYDADRLWSIAPALHTIMDRMTEDVTTTLVTPPAVPGREGVLMLMAVYAGPDEEAAREVIRPLLDIEGYKSHELKPMRYADVLDEKPAPPAASRIVATNMMVKDGNDDFYRALADFYQSVTNPMIQIRYINGAFNRVAEDATAYGFRDSSALIVTGLMLDKADAGYQDEEQRILADWRAKLAPYMNGLYVNFMSGYDRQAKRLYAPATYDRLLEIKRRYDPRNVFHRNYNIDPAADTGETDS